MRSAGFHPSLARYCGTVTTAMGPVDALVPLFSGTYQWHRQSRRKTRRGAHVRPNATASQDFYNSTAHTMYLNVFTAGRATLEKTPMV